MNTSFSTPLVNSDLACVTFKSCDGRSIEINKYFLYLYDAFYRNILEENMEERLVFIFEGAKYDELILFRDQIYQKHLQCVDHSQNQSRQCPVCFIDFFLFSILVMNHILTCKHRILQWGVRGGKSQAGLSGTPPGSQHP